MASLTEEFNCNEVNDSSDDYGLRIAALFAILAVSAIGGSLPWICRTTRLRESLASNPWATVEDQSALS